MSDVETAATQEIIEAVQLANEFKRVPALATLTMEDLRSLGTVEVVTAPLGSDLFEMSGAKRVFWVLLEGQTRFLKREDDGSLTPLATASAFETFGEVPLLIGKEPHGSAVVLAPSRLIRICEEKFWKMMACCPQVRANVLANMAQRLMTYQSQALHREKLISLGTLAAGLMHELNNPGAAARRAASQLRENLSRLQLTSLRICSGERKTPGQVACLRSLQEQALQIHKPRNISSLEESDAEEALAAWLERHGVENAWKLAPTLSTIGLDPTGLTCAQEEFQGSALSDPLNWLEALISSMQLVGTIEESISRVTDLVKAVKKYGYEDKAERHELDIHDGILNTLVILAHKFREKELSVVKSFGNGIQPISTCGRGLTQVWTNLLDNAIDASPRQGSIAVRTWADGTHVCVGITDNGPGIPKNQLTHVFEPFYTTKPAGEGTGLGLDIVHRIVVGQFAGHIEVDSVPGKTEFIVMLPFRS
jgi:signal transduction histidine kinase